MAVTAGDFDRIETFLRARIDPLLAAAQDASDDGLVIALAALGRAVQSAHDIGTDLLKFDQGLQEMVRERAVDQYWDTLGTIAYEWRAHPDYLSEFELGAIELGGVAPLPAAV
ncbi:hypothetical protein ACIBEA_40450 [Streptomyces sp. NPDC051555]|uniref:hypothetical protein n=1 Tax=Streptomyces sp. NPDC051555 TaxID=3365657 RepID=UPI0037AEF9EF